MHKALHPREDVDWLYLSWNEGGRGFASIEDSVDALIQRPEDYTNEGLITAIRNDRDNTIDDRMTTTRKQKLVRKNNYMDGLTTNKQHLTPENLDLAKKRKP